MTPEEIEQGNKLIAEFMGWTKGIGCWHHHDDGGYRESLIEYHNDWNELMPVVEKIAQDFEVEIDLAPQNSSFVVWDDRGRVIAEYYREGNPIDMVYQGALRYIKKLKT